MKKMILLFVGAFLMLSPFKTSAQGFTGYYDPANWEIQLPAPQYGGNVLTFNSNMLVIAGPNGEDCWPLGEEVRVAIIIPTTGTISFTWDWLNLDSDVGGFDFFIILQTNNNTDYVLLDITDTGSGTFSETLNAGDKLSFVIFSVDCIFGEGIATITNFSAAAATPVPISNWSLNLSILLMIAFVVIRFRRMM